MFIMYARYSAFVRYVMGKKSFQGFLLCFSLHDSVFARAKILNFDEVQLICMYVCVFVYVYTCVCMYYGLCFSSQTSRLQRFSSRNFIVLGFTLSSMIHFEFMVLCSIKHI